MEAAAVDGNEQLDAFFITNKTSSRKVFALYWFTKTNSHVAVASWSTNGVVDWGDEFACFESTAQHIFIFPGFTNVADAFSEAEMRKYCNPIFNAVLKNEGFPGLKRLPIEPTLPPYVVGPMAIRMPGFSFKITGFAVTTSNVTLDVQGVLWQDKERTYPTNNVGKLTFGKDLNLIEAKVITNSVPSKPKS
jgi:hypothetical protein